MIYSLSGRIQMKGDRFLVVDTGGVGFKVAMTDRGLRAAGPEGAPVSLFTHFHMREDGVELYGFIAEEERAFFELLISVSGVGPKSALSIMEVSDLKDLASAIKENRPDLLTRASGIGRKTAERIIIDLKSKVEAKESESVVKKMEGDSDIVEALVDLGYRREAARAAVEKVEQTIQGLEARLKAALKILSSK